MTMILLLAASLTMAPPSQKLFVSPMGEPFLGTSDAPPDAAWFAQADADHDGKLTEDEMVADALRFFKTLDKDGSGEIDPEELETYEATISRAALGKSAGESDSDPTRDGPDPLSDAPKAPTRYISREAAAKFNYFGLPEPVASADTDFNRGVSTREFARAASKRFKALDLNGDGVVPRGELPKAPRG